jgi:DNA-binding NtrC family response regulator
MAALRPGISVIYMSGYADDSTIRDAIGEPGYTLLHKPFRLDSLKRTVQAALSAARQNAPAAAQGVVI